MDEIDSFEALNEAVLDHVCSFIEQWGVMKSMEVNCDNMDIMLRALCSDLHIPLQITNFITDYEQDFQNELLDQHHQYLEILQHLNEEEFNEVLDQMNDRDYAAFEQFINQFKEEDENTPKFDA